MLFVCLLLMLACQTVVDLERQVFFGSGVKLHISIYFKHLL